MSSKFKLVATPPFEHDVRKESRKNSTVPIILEKVFIVLKKDPVNLSRSYPIKKLVGVKPGQGQWRIRSSCYRLRYDMVNDEEVVLHSFRPRPKAY